MAAWLPALKAVLPYVTNIVTAAIPAFTSRKGQDRSAEVTAQQIAELQSAATHNAESVKVLAEQLQRTVTALEQGAVNAERVMRQARLLAMVALCLALAGLAIAVVALVR
jgi:hypothetical protein